MRHAAGVVLIPLLCVTTGSAAKITARGVKVGLNSAFVSSGGCSYAERKLGVLVGGFATIKINGTIAIQPELLYTMKGAQSEVEFLDQYGTRVGRGYWRCSLNYLEMPLLIRTTVPVGHELRPSLFAGPYVGIKLASIERLDPPSGVDWREEWGDYPISHEWENIKRWDFGIVFGAGFDVALGPGGVRLGVRYASGLTDINEKRQSWVIGTKNRVFTVMLGYAW